MAAGHLAVFGLAAAAVVELCLRGFRKIPFTCSYLPGKSNLHITACLCLMLGVKMLYMASEWERQALWDNRKFAVTILVLAVAVATASWRTQQSGGEAVSLIFEEEQPPEVASLGLFRDGFLPKQPGD